MGIGQLHFRIFITIIHRHIVAWLAITVQCLGRDGSRQADNATFRSLQRQFSIVVMTVRSVVAAVVIDLEENGI